MPGRYNGSLTREQFMFREMRAVARLLLAGKTPREIERLAVEENLFGYPTQGEIAGKCRACLRRAAAIEGMPPLLELLADGAHAEARQAALAAMALESALVHDFMTRVVGVKVREADLSLTRADMNRFFLLLAQEDAGVATWSDATVRRIKGVLRRCLVEAEYLTDMRSERLLPVCVSDAFARALADAGHRELLPAFGRLG